MVSINTLEWFLFSSFLFFPFSHFFLLLFMNFYYSDFLTKTKGKMEGADRGSKWFGRAQMNRNKFLDGGISLETRNKFLERIVLGDGSECFNWEWWNSSHSCWCMEAQVDLLTLRIWVVPTIVLWLNWCNGNCFLYKSSCKSC